MMFNKEQANTSSVDKIFIVLVIFSQGTNISHAIMGQMVSGGPAFLMAAAAAH